MADSDEQSQGTSRTDFRAYAPGALEAAQSYVVRSAGPGAQGYGGGESFAASFAALLEWGESRGLIRPENEFPFFLRRPDGYGDEHEAWFDEPTSRWFKATYPNRFGLAWGRDGSATAGEYLTRLILQNRYFGDDLEVVALVESNQKLRVVTSQRHVPGEPATYAAIQAWFVEIGFRRLQIADRIAWYREDANLLVADAHEGNVMQTAVEGIIPIDLNIIQPDEALKSALLSYLI
jgi:hypothetical protein